MTPHRAERVYALLLRAYPAGFRAAYEREMRLAFRELARGADASALAFWVDIVRDVVRSAPALRAESLRAWWKNGWQLGDGPMRPMGILAVVIGLLQLGNGVVEAMGDRPDRSGPELALVILTVFAAPLLIAAGIALLRHSPRAALLSQIVAVFWLALAAVAQIAFPWMSIFSRLLAFVFPIALLLFVWRRDVRRMA